MKDPNQYFLEFILAALIFYIFVRLLQVTALNEIRNLPLWGAVVFAISLFIVWYALFMIINVKR